MCFSLRCLCLSHVVEVFGYCKSTRKEPIDNFARIRRTFWQDHFDGKPPETIRETLKLIKPQIFPNIHACLKILGERPATSCECERSISKIVLVLTDKRGTMGQGRFNSLVLLSVHKDIWTCFF